MIKRPARRYPAVAHAVDEWVREVARFTIGRGWPLHRPHDVAPFFIVSAGRSGTTLLRRLLETHANVHIPPEMYGLKPAVRRFKRNRFKAWDDVVHLTVSSYDYERSFGDYGVPIRDLVLGLKALKPDDRSLAKIIGAIYRHHADRVASRPDAVVGDKTPMNIEAVDEIFEVFPAARVVHMVRDGIDVVCSLLETGFFDDPDVAARRWKRSIEVTRAAVQRHPTSILTMRYEDLVVRPVDVVKAVCAFVGARYVETPPAADYDAAFSDIAHYDRLRNALKPVFTESIGRGRRRFTASQLQHLVELLRPQLEQCGYATERDEP